MIYLIKSGPYIKIGTTISLKQRFGTLQTANPERLLIVAIGHGGEREERLLHTRLKKLRTRKDGEWFALRWYHVGWLITAFGMRVMSLYGKRCARAYKALFRLPQW